MGCLLSTWGGKGGWEKRLVVDAVQTVRAQGANGLLAVHRAGGAQSTSMLASCSCYSASALCRTCKHPCFNTAAPQSKPWGCPALRACTWHHSLPTLSHLQCTQKKLHLGVAQHDQAVLGTGERHIEAARVRQEADALKQPTRNMATVRGECSGAN